MSKESLLARVDVDIASGDLGKARDRLHTLIFEHPGDLSLRARLAEVYDRLQQPAQAGRYWYLAEPLDDRMAQARAAYERLVGNDPVQVLAGLKLRDDGDALAGFARQTVGALRDRIRAVYGERLPPSVRVRSWKNQKGRAHLLMLDGEPMVIEAGRPMRPLHPPRKGRPLRRRVWYRCLPAVRCATPLLVLAGLGTVIFLLVRALLSCRPPLRGED